MTILDRTRLIDPVEMAGGPGGSAGSARWFIRRERLMFTQEFIGEPVTVFGLPDDRPHRSPAAPAGFRWRDMTCQVHEVLEEWWDFSRPSRRQRAYGEGYQRRAPQRGSFGLGRRHFVVRCGTAVYHLCYDRRPAPSHPGGTWVLLERRSPISS